MNDQSQRPKTLLALDIGTHTGWMIRLPEGEKHHGSWKFPSGQPTGNRMLNLYQSLFGLLKEYGCMEHDVRIVMESIEFSKNPGSQVLGYKFSGIVEMFASTYGFLPPFLVGVSTWRSEFLKHDGFQKSSHPPKGTKGKAWTEWVKSKTIEQCNNIGEFPQDDNAADAIGIGWWFFNGGKVRMLEKKKIKSQIQKQKKSQIEADV